MLGVFVTMDAEQGLGTMRIMNARTTVPIHYNDYTRFGSPLEDFKRAVTNAGPSDRVHYLGPPRHLRVRRAIGQADIRR